MSAYLEAVLTLLPFDVGGRATAILPRDGSYRPYAMTPDGELLRIRVIEGPPMIGPGQHGLVVAEVECAGAGEVRAGAELMLVEREDRQVGILTVMRASFALR